MEAGRKLRLFALSNKGLLHRRGRREIVAEVIRRTGTRRVLWHCPRAMTKFRFVTPHRCGKWYPDLSLAQRFADAIGAGFLERRTGRFVLYPETRLEVSDSDS